MGYTDIAFNYHIEIYSFDWDKIWEGRIHAILQNSSNSAYAFSVVAVGYMANLTDKTDVGLSYTTPTELGTIIHDALVANCPMLVVPSSIVVGKNVTFGPARQL